jgi:hypothetical protein
LAVYRWKRQNHQRPQRSQRHRRELGRGTGGPWWTFVITVWTLSKNGFLNLYRFDLANVRSRR